MLQKKPSGRQLKIEYCLHNFERKKVLFVRKQYLFRFPLLFLNNMGLTQVFTQTPATSSHLAIFSNAAILAPATNCLYTVALAASDVFS